MAADIAPLVLALDKRKLYLISKINTRLGLLALNTLCGRGRNIIIASTSNKIMYLFNKMSEVVFDGEEDRSQHILTENIQ